MIVLTLTKGRTLPKKTILPPKGFSTPYKLQHLNTFTEGHVFDLCVRNPLSPEVELSHRSREALHLLEAVFVPHLS